MTLRVQLVEALKRVLKAQGLTYANLAERIGMSEASVKRMFSEQSIRLERGAEMGRFNMGSTVILLLPAAGPCLDPGLVHEQAVRVRQDMGALGPGAEDRIDQA